MCCKKTQYLDQSGIAPSRESNITFLLYEVYSSLLGRSGLHGLEEECVGDQLVQGIFCLCRLAGEVCRALCFMEL